MAKTLIENGWVIPMSRPDHTIPDGAVAIDGHRIVAVGTAEDVRKSFKPDKVVSARGKAVLPGLVNTHTHLVGAFNKGTTEDAKRAMGGSFKRAIPLQEDYVNPEDVYFPSLVHGIEAVKTGTTTLNEMWWYMPEPAKVVRDLGVRAVVGGVVREMNTGKITPGKLDREWLPDLAKRNLDECEAMIQEWHGAAKGRITARVAPDGPDRARPEVLAKCGELARKYKVGLHTHCASVPAEQAFMEHNYGKRSVEVLKDCGLMGPDMVAVHCVFMSDKEMEIFKETDTKFGHTAYLVGKRGYLPPMEKFYTSGIDISLGSDWISNDMWNVMRAAIILARVQSGNVELIDAWKALHMATMGGAKCLGMEKDIGSLEAGKKADIILVDIGTAWVNPIRRQNIVSDLVYNANGSDVTHVWVDGELIVDDKRLTTVDESEAIRECQKIAERVWERGKHLFGDEALAAE
jgi:5-methylthioadenosine/S-adenosylhomocysteine deaminase